MDRDKEVKLQMEFCETLQKKLGESVRKLYLINGVSNILTVVLLLLTILR